MLHAFHRAWHNPITGPIILIVIGLPILLIAFVLYAAVPFTVLVAAAKALVTGNAAALKSASIPLVVASAVLWTATIAYALSACRTGGGRLRVSATVAVPVYAPLPDRSRVNRNDDPGAEASRLAADVRARVAPILPAGVVASEIIEEDYGAGFWLARDKDTFWFAIGEIQPDERPGANRGASREASDDVATAPERRSSQFPIHEFAIFFSYDPGLDLVRRALHRPDAILHEMLWNRVQEALASVGKIEVDPRPA